MRFIVFLLMLSCLAVPARADCVSPAGVESQSVYDFANHRLTYCNGSAWVVVTATAPAGGAGQVQFNGGGAFGASNGLFWDNANRWLGVGTSAPVKELSIAGGGGTEGTPGIFIQDPTTGSDYGGRLYYDDSNGLEVFKLASVNANADGALITLERKSAGNVGINTDAPMATLDVNGYGRFKLNGAAPVACAVSYHGSIALTSAADLCVCTTANAWRKVNTATACAGP